jgi:hypothetical protein
MFSFRRSKKLGPFRLTLSKRGVGVSVGRRPFRLTRTAAGRTNVTVAGHGARWTRTLKRANRG